MARPTYVSVKPTAPQMIAFLYPALQQPAAYCPDSHNCGDSRALLELPCPISASITVSAISRQRFRWSQFRPEAQMIQGKWRNSKARDPPIVPLIAPETKPVVEQRGHCGRNRMFPNLVQSLGRTWRQNRGGGFSNTLNLKGKFENQQKEARPGAAKPRRGRAVWRFGLHLAPDPGIFFAEAVAGVKAVVVAAVMGDVGLCHDMQRRGMA